MPDLANFPKVVLFFSPYIKTSYEATFFVFFLQAAEAVDVRWNMLIGKVLN